MTSTQPRPFFLFLSLTGITLIGSILRLYGINYQSLWLDELYSIIPTDPLNSVSSLIDYCKTDQPPAFFLYLYFVFKVFGYHEIVGRMACAAIGIISIPLCYFLGKEIQDKRTGLLVALLTSINYFHIYYSQDLRFYSLTFLFTTLSYLFFIRAYKYNTYLDYFAYVLFTIGLLYTHYFGILIYCIQSITFIILIIYFRRDRRFLRLGFISGVLVFVAFIPWLPVITKDMGITSYWVERPKVSFLVDYLYGYFGKDIVLFCGFSFSLFMFIKHLVRPAAEKQERAIYVTLIFWFFLSYLVPYVKSISGTPILSARYTIIALPVCMIIFAIGLVSIRSIKWQYIVVVSIVLSALINLLFLRDYYNRIGKTQFREASELVLLKNSENRLIVSSLPWHFSYYFRNQAMTVSAISAVEDSLVDKFWLLQAHFPIAQREAETDRLSKDFEILERYSFHEADALLMVKRK